MAEQLSVATAQPSVATGGVPGTAANGSAAAAAKISAPRPPAPKSFMASGRKWLLWAALVVAGGLGFLAWKLLQPEKLPPGFASSNGRIEATEIDIATKRAERIKDELVDEGDMLSAGQIVAHMDTDKLEAQLAEAEAKLREAESGVISASKTVVQRKSEKLAAEAVVLQRQSELDLAKKNLARAEELVLTGGMAKEEVDTRRAALANAVAAISKANADVAAADAAIATAESLVIRAHASVKAAEASMKTTRTDIDESTLRAPRAGRVQYRVAQPGEVLNAGGKVLNMIDLNDVYMTFFLPTDWAGRVKLGAEARIVLDAAPQYVIPAKVTFVADVAQFTPKTVETAEERQKLTFRIKAHIPRQLLQEFVRDVKTGLPGVAYVQLDPAAPWPAHLQVNVPNPPASASEEKR